MKRVKELCLIKRPICALASFRRLCSSEFSLRLQQQFRNNKERAKRRSQGCARSTLILKLYE
eukprot:scaffold4825_cov132-Cylindrotheca_fusiformis.AAC.2